MTRQVIVDVDLTEARSLLLAAGFENAGRIADEHVTNTILDVGKAQLRQIGLEIARKGSGS